MKVCNGGGNSMSGSHVIVLPFAVQMIPKSCGSVEPASLTASFMLYPRGHQSESAL